MSNKIAQAENFMLPKIRRLTQLIMVGVLGKWAFYGIFRCPFIVPFVNCQNCPVITCWGRLTTYFYSFWLFLPLSVFLFGRAFCGWLCPAGFVNQLIGKLSIFKLRVRSNYLRIAQAGMVIAIAICLVVYAMYDNPRLMVPIRVGEFVNSVRLSFEHASLAWLVRTSVVLGLIAAGIFISNLWCRFACPMGGVLEIFKRFSVFRVYKTSDCDNCNACLKKCEMGTRPDEMNCTNCGSCLNTCHKNAIKFGRKEE